VPTGALPRQYLKNWGPCGRESLDVAEALVGEYRKSGDWPAKIKLHI